MRHTPPDQADGLRRLFATPDVACVLVPENQAVAHADVAIERLTSAFTSQGLNALIVDAGSSAREAHELTAIDLAACVEAIAPRVSYLAARGLALLHAADHDATHPWQTTLAEAAPGADVLLVHAPASQLARLLVSSAARPVLLVDESAGSLDQVLSTLHLLRRYRPALAYDLLVVGDEAASHTFHIGHALTALRADLPSTQLQSWAVILPAQAAGSRASGDLQRLASTHRIASHSHPWTRRARLDEPRPAR